MWFYNTGYHSLQRKHGYKALQSTAKPNTYSQHDGTSCVGDAAALGDLGVTCCRVWHYRVYGAAPQPQLPMSTAAPPTYQWQHYHKPVQARFRGTWQV